jgi:nucleoside-diphosphate-sugar epimerase
MTKITITGATGVVGRRAVRELVAGGRQVTGITRSAQGRRVLERFGARAVDADVFDEAALTAAFAGADVVVNLLTHIPPTDRMGEPGAWDENDRLRRDASAAIARAAHAAGASRLVQESLTFVYADGGDTWLDEDAPVAAGATTRTALDAEANAATLFPGAAVILRFGLFIGPDSGLTLADVENAQRGISPSVGRRDAHLATVWLDDAATAVAAALRAPAGTYNVADAYPPTRGQVDAALAAAVGRRDGLRPAFDDVPPVLEPVARSQRVSSRRLAEATGWVPRVRGGTDGWGLIVQEALAA